MKWGKLLQAACALALGIGAQSPAQAIAPAPLGDITCAASAAPLTVRAEGIAELLSDIVVTCTNQPGPGSAFDQYAVATITLTLPLHLVTNNVGLDGNALLADAVLIINGNASSNPQLTSVLGGADPRFPSPQFGWTPPLGGNRLVWGSVQFPIPGAPNTGTSTGPGAQCAHFNNGPGGCFPTTTTFRITSVRGNASMQGVPPLGVPASSVTAAITVFTGGTFSISNSSLTVGLPVRGLYAAVKQPLIRQQCEAVEQTVPVQLAETSPTAFRVEGSANAGPGNTLDEAGYFAPGSNGGDGASNATRLILRFNNIPQGVMITAPRHVDKGSSAQSGDALELQLLTGSDPNGAGGFLGPSQGQQTVALDGQGNGFLLYDVRDANPNAVESIDVPLTVAWSASAPALGTGEIRPNYAPITYFLQASEPEPEPRFLDTNDASTLLIVYACGTQPPTVPSPPSQPPTQQPVLTKVSGDGQTVPGGSSLTAPLVVSLTQGGQPLAGRTLLVAVSGAGSQFLSCPFSAATNASGIASVSCSVTKNPTGSPSVVSVVISDGSSQLAAPFSITVQPQAISLRLLSPSTIQVPANSTAQLAIRVLAESGTGPAANIPLSSSTSQGIQIQPSLLSTDSQGIATAAVSVGCISGPGRVDIGSQSGGAKVSVEVEPLPGAIEMIDSLQGGGQRGRPGERLPQALLVAATDECGNAATGLEVSWDVQPSNAATLEAKQSLTNNRGQASTLIRVGSHSGPFTITATIDDKTVEFELETEGGPSALAAISGGAQRVARGEAAPQPLVARVTDPNGNGYSGVRVNFRMLEGLGLFDPSSLLSDERGYVATTFTAGVRLGPVVVEAYAIEGESAQFNLFVTGRKPIVEATSIVDGAAFETGLTGGGAGSIFGVNMMEDINGVMVPAPNAIALSVDGKPQSAGLWPIEFEGVSVHVNGIPAPLFALANIDGSEQINFQVPFDVASASVASIEINNNGNITTVNNVPILPAKPRLFEIVLDGRFYAAALHLDYTLVEPNAPARPGEIVSLFLTGLGPTDPPVPTNLPGPIPPAVTMAQPVVTIDGVEQEVLGSFYAPQLTSVYQVNMRINEGAAPAEREIEVLVDGQGGQRLLLPVGAR